MVVLSYQSLFSPTWGFVAVVSQRFFSAAISWRMGSCCLWHDQAALLHDLGHGALLAYFEHLFWDMIMRPLLRNHPKPWDRDSPSLQATSGTPTFLKGGQCHWPYLSYHIKLISSQDRCAPIPFLLWPHLQEHSWGTDPTRILRVIRPVEMASPFSAMACMPSKTTCSATDVYMKGFPLSNTAPWKVLQAEFSNAPWRTCVSWRQRFLCNELSHISFLWKNDPCLTI